MICTLISTTRQLSADARRSSNGWLQRIVPSGSRNGVSFQRTHEWESQFVFQLALLEIEDKKSSLFVKSEKTKLLIVGVGDYLNLSRFIESISGS